MFAQGDAGCTHDRYRDHSCLVQQWYVVDKPVDLQGGAACEQVVVQKLIDLAGLHFGIGVFFRRACSMTGHV